MENFKCFGTTVTNKNHIHKKTKNTINLRKVCYHLLQNLVAPHYPQNTNSKYRTIILPVVSYRCITPSFTFNNRVTTNISGPKLMK